MSYKRNQVEEAITRLLEPGSKKSSSELRTRIKRLLELDRKLGHKPRLHNPLAEFAFFSGKAPGTGADILFSDYETFALLNGLRMMAHGWPQGFAVSVMRRVRPELAKQHAHILRQEPKELFNQDAIQNRAEPGDLAVDSIDPVFLTVVSKAQRPADPTCAVCYGREKAVEFIRKEGASGYTMFELATMAQELRKELQKTRPRRRGRG